MAATLLTKTRQFLQNIPIDYSNKHFLMAVSGGIDSVVMAHVFHQLGIKASIAHCNFTLRGEESDKDAEFVVVLGEKLGFPVYIQTFATKQYAKQHSISTQMAARNLRYQWFAELVGTHKFDYIAIAQHTDDNLETILLNLVRGTGMAGLRGIMPLKEKLIRPLLFSNRQEIAAFADLHAIQWREDASNQSDDYSRNLLRHHVLPVLKQINPSLTTTFQDTAERLFASEQLLRSVLQEAQATTVTRSGEQLTIDIPALHQFHQPILLLSEIITPFGFNYQQAKDILKATKQQSGKSFFSEKYVLLKDRTHLLLQPITPTATEEIVIDTLTHHVIFGGQSFLFSYTTRPEQLTFEAKIAHIDVSTLEFPLTLRRWRKGDKIAPLGMKGRFKKVSDVFIDAKLSQFEKDNVAVLENGDGTIIWLAGLRLAEKFAVTPATQQLLTIQLVTQ